MKLRQLLLGSVLTALGIGGVAFAANGPQPGINSPWATVWEIPIDSIKWSYGLGFTLSPSVVAQDVFTLCGDPLSQVVTRVTRIQIGGRATVPNPQPIFIIKRGTPTTGGLFSVEAPFFSSTTTGVPYDTTNQSPSRSFATAWTTTTNPIQPAYAVGTPATGAGSGSGLIASGEIMLSGGAPSITFDWGNRPTQAPVLRGSSQCLAVNLSNSTNSGNIYNFQVEWTEE